MIPTWNTIRATKQASKLARSIGLYPTRSRRRRNVCALVQSSGQPATPGLDAADPLMTLRAGHPRLYLDNQAIAKVRTLVKTDATARNWLANVEKLVEQVHASPVTVRPPVNPVVGILDTSRQVLGRVAHLAGLYLINDDPRHAIRARDELLAAASFVDWNPDHFLDTAEMTEALAIGYDWLYSFLSVSDRMIIRNAIIEKGLKAGLTAYGVSATQQFWVRASHNWNLVCNAGLVAGALAIGDESHDFAAFTLYLARLSVANGFKSYAPDGAWVEGPAYWHYGSAYAVFLLGALEALSGTTGVFGAPLDLRTRKISERLFSSGTRNFNFGDSVETTFASPHLLWLARAYGRPRDAHTEMDYVGTGADNGATILNFLYYDPGCASAPRQKPPNDILFRGVDTSALEPGSDFAAFRSDDSTDSNKLYLAIKGGKGGSTHGHLDAGSFVLDMFGKRWAANLRTEGYGLPGYFGAERFDYYRTRTEGHNTLTISTTPQKPLRFASQLATKNAPIRGYFSSPNRSHTVVDLSPVYATPVTKARRGFAVLDRKRVLIQDEVTATSPVEVLWNFHTPAAVAVSGGSATLTQGTAALTLTALAPPGATFEAVTANPTPLGLGVAGVREQPNTGFTNVVLRLPAMTKSERIVVRIGRGQAGDEAAPAIVPLDAWIAEGPVGP